MKFIQVIGICLCSLLLCTELYGQELSRKSNKYYVGFGLGYGYTNTLAGLNANFIGKNRWGFNLAYRVNRRIEAQNLPQNYESGLCFFGKCTPHDYSRSISFNIIRDFPLKNAMGSATIEFGPSMLRYREAQFTAYSQPGLYLGSNYTTTYTERVSPGIHMRASRNFRMTTIVSAQIAATVDLNWLNSFLGFEFYFLMGDLNNERKY